MWQRMIKVLLRRSACSGITRRGQPPRRTIAPTLRKLTIYTEPNTEAGLPLWLYWAHPESYCTECITGTPLSACQSTCPCVGYFELKYSLWRTTLWFSAIPNKHYNMHFCSFTHWRSFLPYRLSKGGGAFILVLVKKACLGHLNRFFVNFNLMMFQLANTLTF